jgi:hypothetical protein
MTVIGFHASMMANSAMMDGGLGVHAQPPLLPTSIRRRQSAAASSDIKVRVPTRMIRGALFNLKSL